MKTIFRTVLAVLAIAFATQGIGNEQVKLDTAPINLHDTASLQRGARNFVNYCLNCHNAAFMRYSALTKIGLTEDQIRQNLMFTTDKIGDTMVSPLDAEDAKKWLGTVPPDLTLVARVRGTDWLYTFLRSFYRDDKAPTGWNNSVFPNVAMPHVLHDLQGTTVMTQVGEQKGHDGHVEPIMKAQIDRAGSMSREEYDLFVLDLVNYLTYMGEPARTERTQIGVLVLLFLVLVYFATLWLKHEYWKDVK
ncbi:MAG: cytochrome c1 [Betaproteobacteria bacterium]|nr:cytochrome c1 [Betaproteobacteria bacterium]